MKKTISLALVLLLSAAALPVFAAEAVALPALGVYLSPEPGQALTLSEPEADNAEEDAPYAVLTDGAGNRMDLWRIDNPDWAGLDLSQLSAADQLTIADYVVYGPDYLRLGDDDVARPDTTLLSMGEFPFLGISYLNEDEEQVDCLFAVLPEGALYCTFAREDGEPIDANQANALMTALYSLSATEEGSVPFTEDDA